MPDGFDPRVLEDIQREIKGFGDDVKKLNETMNRDLQAARDLAEKNAKAIDDQTKAQIDALSRSAVERNGAIEAKFAEIDKRSAEFEKRSEQIELALKRAPTSTDEAKANAELLTDATEFFKASAAINKNRTAADLTPDKIDVAGYKAWASASGFAMAMRYGHNDRIDAKALSVGVDSDGGYIVPRAVSNRIMTKFYETSPIRQIAAVETIGTEELDVFIDDGEAGFGWVGESESRSETTTPGWGLKKIPTHEMYAEPRATQKILDDASLNIEAWLANKVADRFARAEATAFVTGNGVNKPRGFMTYPAGTARGQIQQVNSGSATDVTGDGLINLTFALKAPYLAAATWLMKRATEAKVALLKETTTGNYLWRPGLEMGRPAQLLGYPVRQADDMPDVAGGALPIAFGDFGQGYTIVDRMGIRTLRDPFTAKPFVKFYTTRRVGGDVTLFEAIKLQKIST